MAGDPSRGRAAVLMGPGGPFEIREYPIPEVEPDALLAKITLASICGTDVHTFKGERPESLGAQPRLLGHEAVGTVCRLGRNVKTDQVGQPLQEGDRITFAFYSPCGHCWNCLNGLAQCANRLRFRTPLGEFPYFTAAFADYWYIRPGQWVYKVPDGLSDEAVAPANCALATVAQALSMVGIGFGATVVVQGAGGLGLSAIAVAKDMGASRVIAVDMVEDRLKLAKDFGADHLLSLDELTSPEERIEKIRGITCGRGADLVIELTGGQQGIVEGIKMLTPGGTYLLVGMVSGKITLEEGLDPRELTLQGKRLIGSAGHRAWTIPQVLDFLIRTKDQYPFDKLISHKFPLEYINEAMRLSVERKVTRAAIAPQMEP